MKSNELQLSPTDPHLALSPDDSHWVSMIPIEPRWPPNNLHWDPVTHNDPCLATKTPFGPKLP